MYEHLIFFDGECPLCHRAVRHIIEIDVHRRFAFAPLNGETAEDILTGPQAELKTANSLVLVESYQSTDRKFWIRSRAILRVYWLAGNGWGLIGILCFLPCFIGDLLYRWVAVHRHQFKLKMPQDPGPKDRFLP
jgi:predicted DCC family thiol-disulfide oxidoreductase YuxK